MTSGSSYKELEFTVRFLTPAFLGDAEQKGRWRTPPFKALLRQWWRVAYAAQKNFRVNVLQMRQSEGELFGNAWLTTRENGKEKLAASRSKVLLRLERWDQGTLQNWSNLEAQGIAHPEVNRPSIGPHLYLGYGPLNFQGGTTLQRPPAINAGETAKLHIAVPKEEAALVEQALYLMHLYGTAGGRSRNGWGSFVLEKNAGSWPESLPIPLLRWKEALAFDWAQAIGADDQGKPLIWQTASSYGDWKQAMRTLALIRMAVRTQFPFSPRPSNQPEARHWLAYPVTNHNHPWGQRLRLPNSLRFKVRPSAHSANQLVGVIFHVPCQPPSDFRPQDEQIEQVWTRVHALLDELCKPSQQRNLAALVEDPAWRQKVAPQLAGIQLQRIGR